MATNTYTLSEESKALILRGLKLVHTVECCKLAKKLAKLPEGDIAVQKVRGTLGDIDYLIGLFSDEEVLNNGKE